MGKQTKELGGFGRDISGQTARRKAEAAQEEQSQSIAEQRRVEEAKLAEEEDVLGRKKAQAKAGGRSLLTATSPTGVTSLGGTS